MTKLPIILDIATYRPFLEAGLREDLGKGDVTSIATIGAEATGTFALTARQHMVICGLNLALETFRITNGTLSIEQQHKDGEIIEAGTGLAQIHGQVRAILAAERAALNLLQYLSGIATNTKAYVDAVQGTGATILDTRKTLAGYRYLAKYAVQTGGGENHRMRLDDMPLLKDNHIRAAGGIGQAVEKIKAAGHEYFVVECDTKQQVEEAILAEAPRLLLDNMKPSELKEIVEAYGNQAELEASGGITLANVREVAETGVQFISIGALTHSVKAVDIGLDEVI